MIALLVLMIKVDHHSLVRGGFRCPVPLILAFEVSCAI